MKRREGVWLVEFLHSTGWVPFGEVETRSTAYGEAKRWRAKMPQFEYRACRYARDTATPKQPKPTVTRKAKRR
jgi:hypothetical protein